MFNNLRNFIISFKNETILYIFNRFIISENDKFKTIKEKYQDKIFLGNIVTERLYSYRNICKEVS